MTPEEKKLYEGHRQRLAEKSGMGQLSPYERWEYWLGGIIPRRDMRNLAKQMFYECGGMLGVLTTPYEKLIQFKGIGPTTARQIENLRYVLLEGLKESLVKQCTVFNSNEHLHNFCKLQLGGKDKEEVYVIFLSAEHMLLGYEKHSCGTDTWAPVYPEQILNSAQNHRAKYIILVHNHPTDFTSFSEEDFNMTNKIAKLLLNVKIYIEDHFVVSGGLLYSMREIVGGGQYLDGMAKIPEKDDSAGF